MKKLWIVLIVLVSLVSEAKASHLYGGEISWVCLANGKFVFKLDVYRECTGVNFNFVNQTLAISGGVLPRGTNNQIISSITMKPDSNRWINLGNGDITPRCPDPNGASKSCFDPDQSKREGAIQRFPFESDPIQLNGTPPTNGWTFFWTDFARPSQVVNGPSGAMGLRAVMYPIPNPNGTTPPFLTTNQCQDNSPNFAEIPAVQICRGYEFTFNHNAQDQELDSLNYAWDFPLGATPTSIIQYTAPYTYNSPLPNKTFNSNNKPVTLDPLTGEMRMAVYNGSGPVAYATVVRVDAWRCGRVIASIFRDIPFLLFDCDRLPVSGKINKPPITTFGSAGSGSTGDTIIEVYAGELVKLNFSAADGDINANNTPPFQNVTLEPSGFMFSTNFASANQCNNPILAPCATLNPPPTRAPGEPYKRSGLAGVGTETEFRWQTDCNHLGIAGGGLCNSGTGVAGAGSGLFNFVMKTYDDHCPIRSINYPSITVRVKAPITLEEPIVKGASVAFDGKVNVQWAPPIDSANTFSKYDIQAATSNNGTAATSYLDVQTNVTKYKKDRLFPFLNFGPNIYTPIPANKDYYFRMRTKSGCTGEEPSPYSQPVRIIEVEATPSGAATAPRSQTTLTWNAPKPNNPATKPYFIYESPTTYYIHENIDVNALTNPAKWNIIGHTKNRTFVRKTPVCDSLVGYRIEARDTIITYDQGTRIPDNKFDTLVFSTFSIVTATQMVASGSLLAAELDTLQVLANGDVFIKVDLGTTGTAGSIDYQRNIAGTWTTVGSTNIPKTSFIDVGANATLGVPLEYRVILNDKCVPNLNSTSGIYKTMVPRAVELYDDITCEGYIDVTWDAPVGMTNNNIRYKVFEKKDNGPFIQVAGNLSVRTFRQSTITKFTDYYYYIVAENAKGEVNISEVKHEPVDDIRSPAILDAPNVRCVRVLLDGSVEVEWEKIDPLTYDPTENFTGYGFRYREIGTTNWVTYTNNTLNLTDTVVHISKPNNPNKLDAQQKGYDIEVFMYSGCDGTVPSPVPALVKTINLGVTVDPSKKGTINWNGIGIANTNDYYLYKDTFPTTGYNKPLFGSTPTTSYEDESNAAACGNTVLYYTQIEDPLIGCISQSNIKGALYEDVTAPPAQPMNFLTVEVDGSVTSYWGEKSAIDVDMLNFIKPKNSTGFPPVVPGLLVPYDSPGRKFTFPLSDVDASNSVVTMAIQPIDGCGLESEDKENFDFHSTMDIKLNWNACDSTIEIHWNPYEWYNVGNGVEYRVLWDTTGTGFYISEDMTTDTSYNIKITPDFNIGDTPKEFEVYVRSIPTGPGSQFYISRSNRKKITISFASTPRYDYVHYTNVLDDNEVELQVYPDKDDAIFVNIGEYEIFRGISKADMSKIGNVLPKQVLDSTFRFYDYSASTNEYSYFYKVIVKNTCGGPVDTSNYGRTIFLQVDADNEALTNTLTWNEYEGWDSTTAYYNVYRSYNKGGLIKHDVVAPKEEGKMNLFVDDVYNEQFAIGDFCYLVEAVQGSMTTDFGIDQKLNPAISRSNLVCVVQEPLFYIPNAFSPTSNVAENRIFGPRGQFFDWTYYEMIIYNRWGEQVFFSNNVAKGWDGTINGKDPQIGSYVYTIRFRDGDGKEHKRKGTVTLIQ
ncbi:MAG: gliding motility-associated C-terminal domain-containing protein [Flavobacteriales bacterium]|nr:gliding motility-associated C-terminal domain-containing protein [Flavobacteriales bacterium]